MSLLDGARKFGIGSQICGFRRFGSFSRGRTFGQHGRTFRQYCPGRSRSRKHGLNLPILDIDRIRHAGERLIGSDGNKIERSRQPWGSFEMGGPALFEGHRPARANRFGEEH